jgi:biopolymer transport protein TolR
MAMDVGGAGRGKINSTINVTPLVDVMLVLLIIMMLVAPMLQKGVNVQLPDARNTIDKPDQQDQTVVAVDSQNRLHLNGIEIQRSNFGERVKAALEDKTERIVLIRGDRDASYSAIMEAMDQLREAGIENIGLITEPPKERRTTAGGM